DEEMEMIRRFREKDPLKETIPVLVQGELEEMRKEVKKVQVNQDIEKYILMLVRQTREHASVELGASPRAAIALLRACQGSAYLHGRNFVIPDDVKSMAPIVLAHRIYLTIEASLTKTAEEVFNDIIQSVPAPVEAGAI
ncbi:MAG TPA: MoxR family ATPase, partial [Bacillaceae bacterium]